MPAPLLTLLRPFAGLFVLSSVLLSGSALAQGALGMEVTGDSETVAAGGTVSLRARTFNKSSAPLQGTLNISVSMEGATFEQVTSSDPALTCTKAPGTPEKFNCQGQGLTMAPNASFTISLIARFPATTPQGTRRTFIGTAVGFSGQVSSGLFILTVLGVLQGPELDITMLTLNGDSPSDPNYPATKILYITLINKGPTETTAPFEFTITVNVLPEGGGLKVDLLPDFWTQEGDRTFRHNNPADGLGAGQGATSPLIHVAFKGRGFVSVQAKVTGGGSPDDDDITGFSVLPRISGLVLEPSPNIISGRLH